MTSPRSMHIDDIIRENLDALVAEWEAFARRVLPAASTWSNPELGGRSRAILMALVEDLHIDRLTPSPAHVSPGIRRETDAAAHGALRFAAGFSLAQVIDEFRAMRFGVLQLCGRSADSGGQTPSMGDIARFNDAVDRALAESIESYADRVSASRDTFLAVLGHDLRSPLQGIEAASRLLSEPGLSETVTHRTAMRLRRASKMMNGLVTDLLEFTRGRLGRGIPITQSACDLRQICDEALDSAKGNDPERHFIRHMTGDLHIRADASRLRQVLSNLLDNAIHHGDPHAPISLKAWGEEDAVILAVANSGKPIPPAELGVIFEPLVQLPVTTADLARRPTSSLGLGLFIVREIVRGHEGTIDVHSSAETGTVFTIRLPRVTAA
ncbi:MAG: histidine kinase [Gammaproteobacteria bacterium]|nr:histidine kinase [Gammaproteobacteria bacterium]